MSITARPNRNQLRRVPALNRGLEWSLKWGLTWPTALTLSLGLWAAGGCAHAASAEPIVTPQLAAEEHSGLQQDLGTDTGQYYDLERQIELGEFVPAVKELERQIKTIERTQHRYHADLIKPLTLLGDAKHGAQDFPGALEAYGRAIHLTRVSSGLHSVDQVPGVYREAKVYRSAGDLQQANNREEYAWRVLQKTHGRYSAELLPGIHHLADWYGQTYNVLSARALYMRAVRIVEANFDELHPEMVTALRGLAQTYRLERFPPTYISNAGTNISTVTASGSASEDNAAILLNRFPQGEKALKRVVRIQQKKLALLEAKTAAATQVDKAISQEPSHELNEKPNKEPNEAPNEAPDEEPDNGAVTPAPATAGPQPGTAVADSAALARARQRLIAALVELGDWFLLFDRSRVAMQYYAQAEAITAQLTPSYAKVDFSRPQLLHFPAPGDPRPPKPKYRGERKQGFVELNYTITVRGSIANLETLSSSPKGLMDYRVRKSMLAARYRPTFINGAPQSTQNHNYRHQFNYYPSKSEPAKVQQPQPGTEPADDSATAQTSETAADLRAPTSSASRAQTMQTTATTPE